MNVTKGIAALLFALGLTWGMLLGVTIAPWIHTISLPAVH